jgi:hypothetical protein
MSYGKGDPSTDDARFMEVVPHIPCSRVPRLRVMFDDSRALAGNCVVHSKLTLTKCAHTHVQALLKLERVSQRLVVEQQYGQRLEALTASLTAK